MKLGRVDQRTGLHAFADIDVSALLVARRGFREHRYVSAKLTVFLTGSHIVGTDKHLDTAVTLDDVGNGISVNVVELYVGLHHHVEPDLSASSDGDHLIKLFDLRHITELVKYVVHVSR